MPQLAPTATPVIEKPDTFAALGTMISCVASRSLAKWKEVPVAAETKPLKGYLYQAEKNESYTAWSAWFGEKDIVVRRGVLAGGAIACTVRRTSDKEGKMNYLVVGAREDALSTLEKVTDGVHHDGVLGQTGDECWYDTAGGSKAAPVYTATKLVGRDGWHFHEIRAADGKIVAKGLSTSAINTLQLKCAKNVDVGVVVALVLKALVGAAEGNQNGEVKKKNGNGGAPWAGSKPTDSSSKPTETGSKLTERPPPLAAHARRPSRTLSQGSARDLINKFEETKTLVPAPVLTQAMLQQAPTLQQAAGRATPSPRKSFDIDAQLATPDSPRDQPPDRFESRPDEFKEALSRFEANPGDATKLTPAGSPSAGSAASLLHSGSAGSLLHSGSASNLLHSGSMPASAWYSGSSPSAGSAGSPPHPAWEPVS